MWNNFTPFLLAALLHTVLGTEANYERQLPQMSFQQALMKFQLYGMKSYRDAVAQTLNSTLKRISQIDLKNYSALSDLLEGSNRQCFLDMSSILSELVRRNLGAVQWFDASGHLPSGLTGGALHWVGSFSICLSIPEGLYPVKNSLQSHYCTVGIKIPLLKYIPFKMPYGLNIGFCIPRSCDVHIFNKFISKVTPHFSLELDEDATYCHSSPSALTKDAWFWVAVGVVFAPLTLTVSATLLECFIWIHWKINFCHHQTTEETVNDDNPASSQDQCTDHPEERLLLGTDEVDPSVVHRSYEAHRKAFLLANTLPLQLLLSFSIPFNTARLCSLPSLHRSPRHSLALLDGIRVITMLWVIFGHGIIFSLLSCNNALVYGKESARLWSFQLVISGTLSVDTFFLMSGLLTTSTLLPRIKHVSGYLKHCKFWSDFVMHRFVRLTPAYLFVIIVYTGLFHHLYDGPMYPQRPELLDSIFCRQHWWAFYLTNLVYSKEMCMAWAWYLANEFQYSVILAPIFITLIHWNVAVGLLFAFLLVLSSILATFGIAYANGYSAGVLSITSFETVYIKPYTRWSTYAIGLVLGWILIARPKANKPSFSAKNATITATGLALATVFTLSTLFGLYGVMREFKTDLPIGVASFYTAMHRPVFILGVAIVIYLCVNGYADPIETILAWSGFRIPARLTYGVFLIHPLVVLFLTLGSQTPPILDNLYLISLFLVVVPISYAASFLMSLTIELPFMNLKDYILPTGATSNVPS